MPLGMVLVPIAFLFSIAAVLILLGPVGRGLGEWVAGRRKESGDSQQVWQLSVELAELRQRVSELEERLDFAERLLVQQRDRPRLEGEG